MLKELYIKNIATLKNIIVEFQENLNVITGETGAGKTLLLNSLNILFGAKFSPKIIREEADFAEITAIFHPNQVTLNFLSLNGIDTKDIQQEGLILKRILLKDSKSKNYLNDSPISITFLKNLANYLIDIHSQFDNHKLFNNSFHRELIDMFADDNTLNESVAKEDQILTTLQSNLQNLENEVKNLIKDRDYLEYVLSELQNLNPKENEEDELVAIKHQLLNQEKNITIFKEIETLLEKSDLTDIINQISKNLSKLANNFSQDETYKALTNHIETSYQSIDSAIDRFNQLLKNQDYSNEDLSTIEERLLDLRSLAKKHKVTVSELPSLLNKFETDINKIDTASKNFTELEQQITKQKNIYLTLANQLTNKRVSTAKIVDDLINQELKYLKLSNLTFKTSITESEPSKFGVDSVIFKINTSLSKECYDLNKVASGGEIARLMLALKVVLAEKDTTSTIIFDEIDVGVGGEVADLIGDRLQKLSLKVQTICITHSHQVASKGKSHYFIQKEKQEKTLVSSIKFLDINQRILEIARMISGKEITSEAIATAKKLLNVSN
jgi:DNA repair protein RecN (Recombination protein N)